jgi:hypothetical protein
MELVLLKFCGIAAIYSPKLGPKKKNPTANVLWRWDF